MNSAAVIFGCCVLQLFSHKVDVGNIILVSIKIAKIVISPIPQTSKQKTKKNKKQIKNKAKQNKNKKVSKKQNKTRKKKININ